jgi:hypothetical protein
LGQDHSGRDEDVDPLTRASIRFGSDKFGGHQYTPDYHRLLAHFRERPINFLEIGVGGYASPEAGGSSLRTWADYFPHARIVGLDIMPKMLSISPRVSIVRGSQIDTRLLDQLTNDFGPFHVVVDDGSHVPEHMVTTFRHLYPKLAEDGIYIVEDTQTCFGPRTAGKLDSTIFGLSYAIGLQMHCEEGYRPESPDAEVAALGVMTKSVSFYRNFIAILRGNNDYPSNSSLDLSHKVISKVYQTIEKESVDNPAERNVLSRIDMCIWGREFDRAEHLVSEGMSLYPKSLSLMYELKRMMEWAKMPKLVADLNDRIAEIKSDTDRV